MVSRFGICITLQAKMSPTPPLKSSGLPRYNNLGQISWCWKINIFKNFKFAPIRKRFRDSGSGSLCEQKCPPHHLSYPRGYRDTTIQVKSADVEKPLFLKISNLLRFENGFEIRNLHHFVSKKVPHIVSRILWVTEIQRIKSNQLMLKNR